MEIRRVIYSTNAIASLNARMRRAIRARGHFPTEQTALKGLYLTIRSLDPTGKGFQGWMNCWKPAITAFAIIFGERLFPTNAPEPAIEDAVMRIIGVRSRQAPEPMAWMSMPERAVGPAH